MPFSMPAVVMLSRMVEPNAAMLEEAEAMMNAERMVRPTPPSRPGRELKAPMMWVNAGRILITEPIAKVAETVNTAPKQLVMPFARVLLRLLEMFFQNRRIARTQL